MNVCVHVYVRMRVCLCVCVHASVVRRTCPTHNATGQSSQFVRLLYEAKIPCAHNLN